MAATAPPATTSDIDDRVHERRWITLAVLCMSLLIIVMDNTILNVAIPSLVDDLGATNSQLQWIIDSYTLVFAGLLLTTGSLGDRFGRKGALQRRHRPVRPRARRSSALSDVADAPDRHPGVHGHRRRADHAVDAVDPHQRVPRPRERGRAIAIWAGFSGLGVAIGPMIGGILLRHFSWSSVFWVNIPIGITALVARRTSSSRRRRTRTQAKLDLLGAVLSIVGLGLAAVRHHRGPGDGLDRPARSSPPSCIGVVAASAASSCGSCTRRHPMLDMRFFQNPRFTRGQQRDHAHVLRHVRLDVPDDPVLAVRARLHAAAGRRAAGPVRRDDDDHGARCRPGFVERVGTKRDRHGRPARSSPARCSALSFIHADTAVPRWSSSSSAAWRSAWAW